MQHFPAPPLYLATSSPRHLPATPFIQMCRQTSLASLVSMVFAQTVHLPIRACSNLTPGKMPVFLHMSQIKGFLLGAAHTDSSRPHALSSHFILNIHLNHSCYRVILSLAYVRLGSRLKSLQKSCFIYFTSPVVSQCSQVASCQLIYLWKMRQGWKE